MVSEKDANVDRDVQDRHTHLFCDLTDATPFKSRHTDKIDYRAARRRTHSAERELCVHFQFSLIRTKRHTEKLHATQITVAAAHRLFRVSSRSGIADMHETQGLRAAQEKRVSKAAARVLLGPCSARFRDEQGKMRYSWPSSETERQSFLSS